MQATITCEYTGTSNSAALLPRCNQFRYLGGLVPSVLEDLRRLRGISWAAFRSIRVALQNDGLPDQLRDILFAAVVETVLLYNAETWTPRATLEKQLNSAHSALLRAAFGVRRQEPTTNRALYQRARLHVPSKIVRLRRLKVTGHLLRAESYCPEPAQDILFLSPQNPCWRDRDVYAAVYGVPGRRRLRPWSGR
jgi:hypothetical protein